MSSATPKRCAGASPLQLGDRWKATGDGRLDAVGFSAPARSIAQIASPLFGNVDAASGLMATTDLFGGRSSDSELAETDVTPHWFGKCA